MRTKTTKAGTRARDFDQLGDPFIPEGELLSDAPDAMSVNADMERLDRHFDNLHIDAGMGPTRIPSAENAAQVDARHELERQMRDRVLFGPTNGDPFQDGHRMAITAENYLRFAPATEREPIEAAQRDRQNFGDALWSEFQARYPEEAKDGAAVEAAVNYELERGVNPRANPEQFLRDVALNVSAGLGRASNSDSGRTVGIHSGGAVTPRAQSPDADMSDTEWTRRLQAARGIY